MLENYEVSYTNERGDIVLSLFKALLFFCVHGPSSYERGTTGANPVFVRVDCQTLPYRLPGPADPRSSLVTT